MNDAPPDSSHFAAFGRIAETADRLPVLEFGEERGEARILVSLAIIGVLMMPGSTAFTRMPRAP